MVPNTTYVPEVPAPQSDDRRVVYVGHLSPDRGAGEMIELARLLRPHGVMVELIGPADARARAQMEPAQADGLLRWHSFVPNEAAMKMMDGALAGLSLLHDEPKLRHSMPTKVVEYMARGVPVVTTPLPIAAELASGHECGFVVPFGDVGARRTRCSNSTEMSRCGRRWEAAGMRRPIGARLAGGRQGIRRPAGIWAKAGSGGRYDPRFHYVRIIHLPLVSPFPFYCGAGGGGRAAAAGDARLPGALWFAGDSFVYLGAALRPQPDPVQDDRLLVVPARCSSRSTALRW